MHFGFIKDTENGDYLARVGNGKITSMSGEPLYSLVGDMIVAEDGTELGYLSPYIGITKGTGDLANQLFRKKLRSRRES